MSRFHILLLLFGYLSKQIDHDVCSNYGNWLYSAGIGNDPRENRKFNMIKQGLDYDSNVRCGLRQQVWGRNSENGIISVPLPGSFRVTTYAGGSQSCRASRAPTCTRLGPSARPRCRTPTCPSVRRTQPPSSSRLNGADTWARNRCVCLRKGKWGTRLCCVKQQTQLGRNTFTQVASLQTTFFFKCRRLSRLLRCLDVANFVFNPNWAIT